MGQDPYAFYGLHAKGVFSTTADAEAANLSANGVQFGSGDVYYADLNADHIIDAADRQVMTIDKPPALPVKECLRLIRDIEKGKTESATIHQNNGARDVPAFLCKPAVIDKTNLESVFVCQ